jgi:hypothetical protein
MIAEIIPIEDFAKQFPHVPEQDNACVGKKH